MVMNRTAHRILKKRRATGLSCHDWFSYLVVAGAGGRDLFGSASMCATGSTRVIWWARTTARGRS